MNPCTTRRSLLGILGFLVVLVAGSAQAQNNGTRVALVTSDPHPIVGRPFQIQIEATSDLSGDLVPPSFGDLEVVGQSGMMRSQSIRQVFGQPPQIEARTSMAVVVVAHRPGIVRIAPATFRARGQTFASSPLVLKITGDGPMDEPDAGVAASTPGAETMRYDGSAFLRAVIDRTDVYVGQQVTYTLYLYRRVDGQAVIGRQSSLDGFWTQDLPDPPNQGADRQLVNGVPFQVQVVYRRALFPTRSGRLTIGGPEIVIHPRPSLFNLGAPDEPITRGVDALTIDVRPLPAGLPATTFVGEGSLRAELDRSTARTGEPCVLTVRFEGRGSTRVLELAPPTVAGLRFDPSTVTDDVTTHNDVVGGVRIFTFPFVPEAPGDLVIPPFTLMAFDPIRGATYELRTQPMRIRVSGAPIAAEPPVGASEPTDVTPAGSERTIAFGPMSRSSDMRRRAPPLHGTPLFGALAVAPLGLLGVLLAALGTRKGVRALLRERDARKAREADGLRDAKRALAKGDAAAFYAGVSAALHAAIDGALGEASTGMTRRELGDRLRDAGADPDLAGRVLDELEGADFARFSASAGASEELGRALERAKALLERLHRLRREPGGAS